MARGRPGMEGMQLNPMMVVLVMMMMMTMQCLMVITVGWQPRAENEATVYRVHAVRLRLHEDDGQEVPHRAGGRLRRCVGDVTW